MTKDQAISVQVRLETAIMALQEAAKHLPAEIPENDTATETINESLEDALNACHTAISMARSVSGT